MLGPSAVMIAALVTSTAAMSTHRAVTPSPPEWSGKRPSPATGVTVAWAG